MQTDFQTIRPEGLALAIVVLSLALFIFNTMVVSLRLWIRSGMFDAKNLWGWDDTVICMAYAAYVPCSIFAILAGFHGAGVPDSKLEKINIAMAANDLGGWCISYAVSLNLVKASIAFAMIRISTERRYTIVLWAFMLAEMVISLTCAISFLALCVPVGAQFDRSLGYCRSYTLLPRITWPFSIVSILSDWACAAVPILIVRKLNMPKPQKRSIMVILAFGALASVAAIVRMPYLKYFTNPEDSVGHFSIIVICSMIETGVGMFASCLPPLHKLIRLSSHKSRPKKPVVQGIAEATIGGTPLSTFEPSP